MDFKVGMIGTGSIAEVSHAPAVQEFDHTELVAVLSRNKTRGTEFLKRHQSNGEAFVDLESFAKADFDIAIVCSPDGMHFEQAKQCLLNGKHVIIEKPMAVSVAEAQELNDLSANEGLLCVGFHLRHHLGHRKLHKLITQDNVIGELKHIRAIWAFPIEDDSNWRAKEEMTKWWSLSAVGSHCLDLVRWFANDHNDWKQFSSVIKNDVWNGPHDETAVISAQLFSGPTVDVTSSVLIGPYSRLEIFGTDGYAICDGTFGRFGGGKILINGVEVEYEQKNPFKEQLNSFTESIKSGSLVIPLASSEAGLRSIKDLTLAVEQ